MLYPAALCPFRTPSAAMPASSGGTVSPRVHELRICKRKVVDSRFLGTPCDPGSSTLRNPHTQSRSSESSTSGNQTLVPGLPCA